MLDPKTQLSAMFGAPTTCVSPIQRPRIESWGDESWSKEEARKPRSWSDTLGKAPPVVTPMSAKGEMPVSRQRLYDRSVPF